LATRPRTHALIIRTLDIVLSASALLVFAPAMLIIAALVRGSSRGPALLRQERVGASRRPFVLFKFRTMHVGTSDASHREMIAAEIRGEDTSSGGSWKLDDPRVTPIGKWLRRSSLDELPQLLNVLGGSMSLVGPRPCLPWEADMFPPDAVARFTVKPGLTGLWQVRGRSTMGTLDMLRLDVDYVRTRSLCGDLSILLYTVPSMLKGGGAR
jgi:lipopolysaccharide/colanic/teichoic acid biosynthesis glycosyltransferase